MAKGDTLKTILTIMGKLDPSVTKAADAAQKKVTGMGKAMVGVGTIIKGVLGSEIIKQSARAVKDFVSAGIDYASDLDEVQNVVDVTFGDDAKRIEEWSKKSLNSFGISELAAKKYASTMGAILDSAGVDKAQNFEMSTGLAERAADIASFFNLEVDEAYQKLQSAMTGETEPMKALGVDMSVAALENWMKTAKGVNKSLNKMTPEEKTWIRYEYLLERTANAQGDFARTSESYSNQQKLWAENVRSASGKVATGVKDAMASVLRQGNALIGSVDWDKVSQSVSKVAKRFSEFADKHVKKAIAGAKKLGDWLRNKIDWGAVGAGVKKAQNFLGAFIKFIFDRFNFEAIGDALFVIIGKLREFGDWITSKINFDVMGEKVDGVVKALGRLFGAVSGNFDDMGALQGGIDGIIDALIRAGEGAIDGLTNALNGIGNFIDSHPALFDALITGAEALAGALVAVKLAQIALTAAQKAGMIIQAIGKAYRAAALMVMMYKNGATLAQIAQWALNAAMMANPVALIIIALAALIAIIIVVVKNWDKIKEAAFRVADMVKAKWNNFKDWMGGLWPRIKAGAVNMFNALPGPLKDVLSGIIAFITGVFTGDWSSAWEGIKQICTGIFDGIRSLFEGVANFILDKINAITGKANEINVTGGSGSSGSASRSGGSGVPFMARGGITSGVTIAGEGGYPEYVIPTDPAYRSRAQSLLDQANQTIGSGSTGGGGGGGIVAPTLNYSPVINVQGGGDRATIAQVLEQERRKIEEMLRQIIRDEERSNYGRIPNASI